MENIEYFVKDEDIRNPQKGKDVFNNLFKGKKAEDYILIVDYSRVRDPVVTMSTGLIFQNFANAGVYKTIIRNHKYKSDLLENPAIILLMKQNKVEVM